MTEPSIKVEFVDVDGKPLCPGNDQGICLLCAEPIEWVPVAGLWRRLSSPRSIRCRQGRPHVLNEHLTVDQVVCLGDASKLLLRGLQ